MEQGPMNRYYNIRESMSSAVEKQITLLAVVRVALLAEHKGHRLLSIPSPPAESISVNDKNEKVVYLMVSCPYLVTPCIPPLPPKAYSALSLEPVRATTTSCLFLAIARIDDRNCEAQSLAGLVHNFLHASARGVL